MHLKALKNANKIVQLRMEKISDLQGFLPRRQTVPLDVMSLMKDVKQICIYSYVRGNGCPNNPSMYDFKIANKILNSGDVVDEVIKYYL